MSQPTQSDVHVSVPLTNLSVAYMNNMADFQADNLAPIIPSPKQTNVFYKYTKDFWFRDAMQRRAAGAQAARVGYGLTTDSYYIDVWAAAKPIDDQTRANEDTPLDSDADAMQFITQLERVRREKSFAGAAMGTGIWGTDITGVSGSPSGNQVKQWDQSGSTPLEDIAKYRQNIKTATGVYPNVLAIGQQVWDILKNHSEITARITGGSLPGNPAIVTRQLVASIMELEEISVLSAVENTAAEGAAFSGSFIVGKVGLLMYRNAATSIKALTGVRTFTWQTYAANTNGTRILKYRDENIHSDIVEMESGFAHKVIASDVGTFFNTVVG